MDLSRWTEHVGDHNPIVVEYAYAGDDLEFTRTSTFGANALHESPVRTNNGDAGIPRIGHIHRALRVHIQAELGTKPYKIVA